MELLKGNNVPQRKRDYKKEYARDHGTPEKIAERSSRNKARRKTNAPKGKEVEHIDGNPKNNSRSNLRFVSAKFQRKQGGRMAHGKKK